MGGMDRPEGRDGEQESNPPRTKTAKAVGFTGTKQGATSYQLTTLKGVLKNLMEAGYGTFHHGDCVGADQDAHEVADEMNFWTICHPPIVEEYRAFTENQETRPTKDYLDRNQDIVDESNILVATPRKFRESRRSGTWATVRRARKKPIPIIIIWPDGNIEKEKPSG